ncbi:MAG: PQQ-dependent sugar dehydrogenase [Pseudomonadota bacterium]
MPRSAPFLLLPLLVAGCYGLAANDGGGGADFSPPRVAEGSDVLLPPGYRIEVVATGLTYPTGIAFDGDGVPHVVEAGYSYGEDFRPARLLRLEADGTRVVIAEDRANVPWNGVAWHDGVFMVSASGQEEQPAGGGKILRIRDGHVIPLVDGLPGRGDHHTNGPAMGPDGWLYFAQGTATNSGVVGLDNWEMGWLREYPDYHDQPCADIVLRGENFTTRAPEGMAGRQGTVVTGAFVPYGIPTRPGQVIQGTFPCAGAVMRVRPEGGRPELVAWGFRNPFGLAFDGQGRLFVSENAYDRRGSRPVFGTADHLWRVELGAWYGWPDFSGGKPLRDTPPLLARHPGRPPMPAAFFAVHSSANGFDFSRSPVFGHVGHAFVAQFGDLTPNTGKLLAPTGFRVVEVDVETGVIHDFAVNAGKVAGPASWGRTRGLERPIDASFDPSGRALYVVDFGILTVDEKGMHPYPGTGVVWRIVRDG